MVGHKTLSQDNNFVDLCNKLFVAFSHWAGRVFGCLCALLYISGAAEGTTDIGFREADGSNL